MHDKIAGVVERIGDEDFEDSFKDIFQQEELPEDAVAELRTFLLEQREQLG